MHHSLNMYFHIDLVRDEAHRYQLMKQCTRRITNKTTKKIMHSNQDATRRQELKKSCENNFLTYLLKKEP